MKKEINKNINLIQESNDKGKVKISSRFITTLAIVSILGFVGIVSQTLFEFNMSHYVESFWMFIIGIGMMIEAKIGRLKTLKNGLNSNNFTHLTTVVIGALAILAGIFSFPAIRIETPAFLAIKGIVSIIAIIVIILQTWIID